MTNQVTFTQCASSFFFFTSSSNCSSNPDIVIPLPIGDLTLLLCQLNERTFTTIWEERKKKKVNYTWQKVQMSLNLILQIEIATVKFIPNLTPEEPLNIVKFIYIYFFYFNFFSQIITQICSKLPFTIIILTKVWQKLNFLLFFFSFSFAQTS